MEREPSGWRLLWDAIATPPFCRPPVPPIPLLSPPPPLDYRRWLAERSYDLTLDVAT